MSMPVGKLFRLVGENALRNRRQFILSAFGIVVGIASFVFFLGLSLGVRSWVLEMFPIDRIEVIAPRTALVGSLGIETQRKLDDQVVEVLRNRPGVKEVTPRMAIAFPALGVWWYQDTKLQFDVVGDGIDPSYVREDEHAALFKDWEAEREARGEAPPTCGPAPGYRCPDMQYCDTSAMTCHQRVPILVSRNLVEIYNTQFAKSRGLPVIGAMEEFIVSRGGLSKMRLYIDLGATMVQASTTTLKARPRQIQGVLLGISDKAIPIGITIPMGYVKRWNQQYLGEEAATTYSSIVVQVTSKDAVGPLAAWIEGELDLRLKDNEGKQFALVIFVVTLFFLLISLVIVTISAINIAHNFFMQVSERRREIGLMRAVGATRADIRGIILGEAALIGLIAGLIGIALALAAGLGFDLVVPRFLPELPFQPDSLFDFRWWILSGGVAFSVVFCVLGGYLPARKGARIPPARALAQQ
jgi:putative ABC transport system permease protein